MAVLAIVLISPGSVVFAKAAHADVGVCHNQVNDPHESGHNPGQVNVTGVTECTIYAAGVWQYITLYQNGIPIAYKPNYQPTGGVYFFIQANTACVPGVYYATLYVYITGGSPNPSNLRSHTVTITC